MALTIVEREYRRIAAILSEFGMSDTDDVPLSDVLRGGLVTLTAEIARLTADREGGADVRALHGRPECVAP